MEVDASYDPSVEFLGGMMPSQVNCLLKLNVLSVKFCFVQSSFYLFYAIPVWAGDTLWLTVVSMAEHD